MKIRNDVKVGLFFVIGVIILLGLFDFLDSIPFVKKEKLIFTYFDRISELREGNSVKLSGVVVGKVSNVTLENGRVKVFLRVKKNSEVRKDSVASIRSISLLGTNYVSLTFGKGPVTEAYDVLPSVEPTDLNKIFESVGSIVDTIDDALGMFATGDNEDAKGIVKNIGSIMGDLSDGKGTLGKLLKDETLYNELTSAFTNVGELTDKLNEGNGTFAKMMRDEEFFDLAKGSLININKMTSSMDLEKGTVGKLLKDEELYDEINQAVKRLNSILAKVDDGKGTVGKLINDDQLYKDSKNTIKKVEKNLDTLEDIAPLSTLGSVLGVITIF
ncbi:MAG: MlaD family protein [Thermodesulfobacteriota bacterium]